MIEQHLDRGAKSVMVLVHNNLALHEGSNHCDISCSSDVFGVRPHFVRAKERLQQRPDRFFNRTRREWQRISMPTPMRHQQQETKDVQVQEVVRVDIHPLRQEHCRMRDSKEVVVRFFFGSSSAAAALLLQRRVKVCATYFSRLQGRCLSHLRAEVARRHRCWSKMAAVSLSDGGAYAAAVFFSNAALLALNSAKARLSASASAGALGASLARFKRVLTFVGVDDFVISEIQL